MTLLQDRSSLAAYQVAELALPVMLRLLRLASQPCHGCWVSTFSVRMSACMLKLNFTLACQPPIMLTHQPHDLALLPSPGLRRYMAWPCFSHCCLLTSLVTPHCCLQHRCADWHAYVAATAARSSSPGLPHSFLEPSQLQPGNSRTAPRGRESRQPRCGAQLSSRLCSSGLCSRFVLCLSHHDMASRQHVLACESTCCADLLYILTSAAYAVGRCHSTVRS